MTIDIPSLTVSESLGLLGVTLLIVLGSARIVRLIAFDSYPPSTWLRIQWDNRVTGEWNSLIHCAYCLAPYIVLVNLAVGMLSNWFIGWVIINVWLAASYLASIVVAYDGDD